MRLPYVLAAISVSLVAAGATYRLKNAVRGLDQELVRLHRQIDTERWALRSTRADLAYLTRPERLVPQAQQLGLVPARGAQIVALAAIPPRGRLAALADPLTVPLPSGAAAVLVTRPPFGAGDGPLPGPVPVGGRP